MDLYGDLPAAADGSSTIAPAQGLTKPAFMMPPPKRPTVRVTSNAMMPPPAKPKTPANPTLASHVLPRPSSIATRSPAEENMEPHQSCKRGIGDAGSTMGMVEEQLLQGDLTDMYDPAKPNDYMEYCEERLEKKRNEERQKELEKYLRVQEEERKKQRPPPGLSSPPAEAAPPGRGRGRGVSNLPAWMTGSTAKAEQLGGDDGSALNSAAAQTTDRFEDSETRPKSEKDRKSLGTRLLARMGYKEGAGLGKDEQGITKALSHRPVGGGQGRIAAPASRRPGSTNPDAVAAAEASKAENARRKKRGLFTNPTRILLLKNMVGPGEVDDELQGETAEECEKYGPVSQCLIFEVHDGQCPIEERVRIFVAFEKQESAVKAYVAMNGRYFGGRLISVNFYDEEKFNKRDLAPSADE